MWLFFMLLNGRKNPKYMFLFFGNNLFLQEQRLMTTTLLLLSTLGSLGCLLCTLGEKKIYSSLCVTGFKQRAFVLWAEYRVGQWFEVHKAHFEGDDYALLLLGVCWRQRNQPLLLSFWYCVILCSFLPLWFPFFLVSLLGLIFADASIFDWPG